MMENTRARSGYKRNNSITGGNRVIPGRCPDLDESYGGVLSVQRGVCSFKGWGAVDIFRPGTKSCGAGYRQNNLP